MRTLKEKDRTARFGAALLKENDTVPRGAVKPHQTAPHRKKNNAP